jgi:hypothetical protein
LRAAPHVTPRPLRSQFVNLLADRWFVRSGMESGGGGSGSIGFIAARRGGAPTVN